MNDKVNFPTQGVPGFWRDRRGVVVLAGSAIVILLLVGLVISRRGNVQPIAMDSASKTNAGIQVAPSSGEPEADPTAKELQPLREDVERLKEQRPGPANSRPAVADISVVTTVPVPPPADNEGNLKKQDQAQEKRDFDEAIRRNPENKAPPEDVKKLPGKPHPTGFEKAFSGREDEMKQVLLVKYGGNADSESAVASSLDWLSRVQDSRTGSWSLTGPYPEGSSTENLCSATAMALLAFQGAGNTQTRGKFKKNVQNGWEFLLKQQAEDGSFFGEARHTQQLYTHGQCTIAVCELYGMTQDPRFLEPAKKAVQFAQASQDRLGGWKYEVNSQSDTSVTGWMTTGLQSARMAQIEVSAKTLANIGSYLDKAGKSGGSKYGYDIGSEETAAMTAEGLLCRQYLGWERDDARLTVGADFLLGSHLPSYSKRNVYYWHYGTQVMHNLEGKRWEQWNRVMRDLLIHKQVQSGPEKGSWHPTRPTPDPWGLEAGRLYITCLSTYILEVYYRHLPIYATPERVEPKRE